MPYIHQRGSPSARIWVVVDKPYPSDVAKGFLWSGGLGYVFEKMLAEAGLSINDCYVVARRPDTDTPDGYKDVAQELNYFCPPIVLVINEAAGFFLRDLQLKGDQDSYRTQMNKYVGSLLESPLLKYPHWMMPLHGPDRLVQDWRERNVTTYVDLQKIRGEIQYWRTSGTVQPLLARTLLSHSMETDEIISYITGRFSQANYLSEDIESIYPRKGSSFYKKHPGYPITLGIADSSTFGISFNLFRETPAATRALWRALDKLNKDAKIIGQNFFNFDSLFISALGFSLDRSRFIDTLIRHHILWPELPHKLQFLTRQYTRQPYYKDEGKNWSMKDMTSLRHYNCLDVCCTYEVFEGQEEEFKQRPHLAA